MTGNPERPQLGQDVWAMLAALRRRIRAYVWLEGLSAAVAWLGLSFWASLAADWFFEPSAWVRAGMVAAAALGCLYVLMVLVGRRAIVPLRDASMALLLERRYPDFRDSLLTAVELTGGPGDAEPCNSQLLGRTCRQAAAPLGRVRLGEVFDPRPLRRSVLAAVGLGVSIALLALGRPDVLSTWARRVLALDEVAWPRRTGLEIDGFPGGVERIARGSDLTILAKADLAKEVPDVLEVRCREGGPRTRQPMFREGIANPLRDRFQEFSHTFHNVLAPIRFDVLGGDAAVPDLRVEVVENPTIVEMVLDCEYPKYTARPARSFPFTSLMQFPLGSRITLRATANKDLVRATVDVAGEQSAKRLEMIEPADPARPRSFQHTLDELLKDTTLLVSLLDTDGIKSREPVRVVLAALEDRRPELAVQLRGIGSAITPQAQLPASGRVGDDYGIARIWFEYAVDKQSPAVRPIGSPAGNATEYPLSRQTLDVRDLKLKPGQKLQVCVKAEDRSTLSGGPNVGTSDRWQLDVVTPDQLRMLLNARELVLRQRFESVIRDVVDARESLARIDFSPPGAAKPAKAPAGGAEPGDKPADAGPPSPERLVAQRRFHVHWAAQNSVKDAHETSGLAEAFSDVREELINNRIDTEELKARLEQGIADPLRRIAQEMFPELDRRLDRLEATLADAAAGTGARTRAIEQVDAIERAMREVLARMIELEDFNEAINLLRAIIQAQERVNAETKLKQKQRLRDLLEK